MDNRWADETTLRGRKSMKIRVRRFAPVFAAAAIASVCLASTLQAATASPLFARGYTVIPEPQEVTLSGQDFEFTSTWRVVLGPRVSANDIAPVGLMEELQERFHIDLSEAKGKSGPIIKLVIDPHAVEVGEA